MALGYYRSDRILVFPFAIRGSWEEIRQGAFKSSEVGLTRANGGKGLPIALLEGLIAVGGALLIVRR